MPGPAIGREHRPRPARVIRVDLAYDGSAYSGYASQPGLRTVQGEIETALDQLIGPGFETHVAGRTDAGVHALGQVVSIHATTDFPVTNLEKSLQRMLPRDIVVRRVSEADPAFDARRSARSRRYRYRIHTAEHADPTRRHNVWWTGPLDGHALSSAAAPLLGTHDFRAFCKSPGATTSTVREVLEIIWREPVGEAVDAEIWLEVAANGFCHQMIRRMAARCVAAARGKCDVAAPDAIENLGCAPAPPQGLYLIEVAY